MGPVPSRPLLCSQAADHSPRPGSHPNPISCWLCDLGQATSPLCLHFCTKDIADKTTSDFLGNCELFLRVQPAKHIHTPRGRPPAGHRSQRTNPAAVGLGRRCQTRVPWAGRQGSDCESPCEVPTPPPAPRACSPCASATRRGEPEHRCPPPGPTA